MAAIELMLEAERRGILPPDKQVLLDEARRRGLVPPKESAAPAGDERTATGQFVRTAALGAAPAAAAMGGFGAGAEAGAALGAFGGPLAPVTVPLGGLLGGLAGAGLAAYGAGKAQEKLIEAAPETSKALGITPEQMAAGAEQHKLATTLGGFIPDIATFELGPERALLRALAEKETRAAAAKELAKQTATNVGIMGAQDVATQAMSDRPFDIKELGEAALTGAVLGRPRGWAGGVEAAGRRLGAPIAAGIERVTPAPVARAAQAAMQRSAERAAARATEAPPEEVPLEEAPSAEAITPEAAPAEPAAPTPRDRVLSVLSAGEAAKTKQELQNETGLTPSELSGATFTLRNEGVISYDRESKEWKLVGRPAEPAAVGEEAPSAGVGGGAELPVPHPETEARGVAELGTEGLGATDRPAVQPDVREEAVQPALAEAPAVEAPKPPDTVRVYHSGSAGEGDSGRWVSTNRTYAEDYRPDLPLFYTDIPANDPRLQGAWPGHGVEHGFTFNFELTPKEATNLKPIERSQEAPVVEAAKPVEAPAVEAAQPEAGGERVLPSIGLGYNPPAYAKTKEQISESLRLRVSALNRQLEKGKITTEQHSQEVIRAFEETKKERPVTDRLRGMNRAIEVLNQGVRQGHISRETEALANWFLRKNPAMADDLAFTYKQDLGRATAGTYDPVDRLVSLLMHSARRGEVSVTPVHEILHHLERMLPEDIQTTIRKEWAKQLARAFDKTNDPKVKQYLNHIYNYHFGDMDRFTPKEHVELMKSALDMLRSGEVAKELYRFSDPSEFFAVNGADILKNRYDMSSSTINRLRQWLREFVTRVKSIFGIRSDAPILKAIDSVIKGEGKFLRDAGMLSGKTAPHMELRAEEPGKPEKTMEQLRSEASSLRDKPGFVKRTVQKLSGLSYEKAAEALQDARRILTKWQNDLKTANRLVTVGEGKNNLADQISTAVNRGVFIAHTEVDPVVRRLQNSIEAYAEATKLPLKKAWEKISGYLIAAHEPLRRETLYLKNVPLDNIVKDNFIPGEAPMTAAAARKVLEKRRSSAKTEAEAEEIRNSLRDLAAMHADPNGESPTGDKSIDINDAAYNVIGPKYSRKVINAARKAYESDPNKALVDQVRKNLTDLQSVRKSLDRRSNYWNDKVENITRTYGWGDTFVSFKGMPEAARDLESGVSYGKEDLAKVPAGFEGRVTEFDDPILQSIADAYTASSRAGRGTDVTDAIKNLANLGIIKLEGKPKKFTFAERNADDFDVNQVSGRDKIISHNSDGSIDVYTLADPSQVDAIKSVYREMNPVLKKIGTLTRGIGMMHTQLNLNFGGRNFVRDAITNTFLIAAKEKPALAAKYVGSVVSHVMNGGLFKAGKISRMLSGKTPEQLKALYKTADPAYRDAIEMMMYGGSSMYRKSFDIGNAMDTLAKELGPNKIVKNQNQLMRWVDAWNDAFETSARVGAYTARKSENIANAKKQGLNVNDPKVMEDLKKEAAAFSLSLMDFGKVGKYGRELSALYMFTRPSATAAVNAIDALRPAFQFDTKKAFSKLEPEIQKLYETHTLAEEVKQLQKAKKPNQAKIDELNAEIEKRQKDFEEFEKNHRSKQLNALGVAAFTTAAGYVLYNMAAAMAGEDEQGRNRVMTDDASRWTQNLRLPIPGRKDYFQVPWGFGISALMAGGAQVAALQNGTSSFKDFAKNMVSIGADSFLPIPVSRIDPTENFGMWLLDSATPSIAKPYIEFQGNMNSFGTPIYNAQSGKYLDAFSGSARAGDTHRAISEFLLDKFGMDFNPDTVAFVLNSYADGINSLTENSWNVAQVARGEKEFDPRTDAFVLRGFIGTGSNYDARKFGEAEKAIQNLSRTVETYKARGKYEELQKFYENHPNAEALIATYNRGGEAALKQLYAARKKINQVTGISPKERKEYLNNVETSINYVKKNMVDRFEAMGLK